MPSNQNILDDMVSDFLDAVFEFFPHRKFGQDFRIKARNIHFSIKKEGAFCFYQRQQLFKISNEYVETISQFYSSKFSYVH